MDEAVAAGKQFVRTWQAERPEEPLKDRDDAQQALDRAEGLMAHRTLDDPAVQARFLELLDDGYKAPDEEGDVTLSAWGSRGTEAYDTARTLRDEAYPELMEERVRPVLRPWQAYVHEQAVAFVEPATEEYLERRREEGQLTHHDVLTSPATCSATTLRSGVAHSAAHPACWSTSFRTPIRFRPRFCSISRAGTRRSATGHAASLAPAASSSSATTSSRSTASVGPTSRCSSRSSPSSTGRRAPWRT
jgi:hypothetical protein